MNTGEGGRGMGMWLSVCALLVPRSSRAAWREEWEGELLYGPASPRRAQGRVRFALGVVRDALAVRRLGHGSTAPRGDGPAAHLMRDTRLAVRGLRRSPGFATVAILTLALGIGATTAIFSVVQALLLNPLPFPDAERLVLVWQRAPGLGVEEDWLSPAQFQDIRTQNDVFDRIAVVGGGRLTLHNDGGLEELGYIRANSVYLGMLGARPAAGRLFADEEDAPDAPIRAVISHALWERSFGADPATVGSVIRLASQDFEVVGVLEKDFLLDNEVMPTTGAIGGIDVVLSRSFSEEFLENRGSENYNIVARLAPGVTEQEAQADLDVIATRMEELYPTGEGSGFMLDVVTLLDQVVGDVRAPLVLLLAAAGVLLLIACGNVANLLLARADGRHQEMGLRAAIGAGRQRLMTALLSESLVLALTGGVAGVALAFAAIRVLPLVAPEHLPRLGEISVDPRVLVFALAVTLLTSVVFGLIPALRLTRFELSDILKSSSAGSMGHGAMWARFNLSSGFAVAEIALSLMLLVGAGLLMRSFSSVLAVDPGFQSEGRITLRVALPADPERESTETLAGLGAIEEGLRAIPGVAAVGTTNLVPLGSGVAWGGVHIPDYEPQDPDDQVIAEYRANTPGYFSAMGIPVLVGRDFDNTDTGEPLTAIVDRKLAERYWPGQDPVGKLLGPGEEELATVVGVVEDVRHYTVEAESRPTVYFPSTWWTNRGVYFVLATSLPAEELLPAVRNAIEAVGPGILVTDVATMEERLLSSLATRRFIMRLLQVFSAVALLLALIGVYGVIAHRVSRGRHEIGMRIALGASTGSILGLATRHGAGLAAMGAALGVAGAILLTRFMRALLFGITATDPATYAAMIGLIVTVTLLACVIPAGRAARMDPLKALRSL